MEARNSALSHNQQPNIVAIGGGTGLSTMLRGLKNYTENITAVVSVADDGGGSGMLRRDLNMLPPGDIRSCILALAKTEPVMERLLQYRFSQGSLAGQNFGNLFLAAMNGIFDGDFVEAVKNVNEVLRVQGEVLPVTDTNVELVAYLESGQRIVGESLIGHSVRGDNRIRRVQLRPKAKDKEENITMIPEVREAISRADLITLGPGSLYTSILPNLVVPGLADAIRSSGVPVLYINNIMTQPGETDGYTAFDHVQAILEHTGPDFLDYCIVNQQTIDTPLLSKYIQQDAEAVVLDENRFDGTGIRLIKRDLVGIYQNRYIRHDVDVLADSIWDVLNSVVRGHSGASVSEEGVTLYRPRHKRK